MVARYVYRKSDGRFIGGGFYDVQPPMVGDPPSPDWVNYGIAEFADADLPSQTDVYDGNGGKRPMTEAELALAFPPPKRKLSKFEFMQLLTPTEFLSMQAAATNGDATLRYALAMFDMASYVETDHPFLAQMFAYAQSINLFSAQRIAEIREQFDAAAHA